MADRLSLEDHDRLLEEHKQRKLEEVQAIERDRQTRKSSLDQLEAQLADTQTALVRATEELAEHERTLESRKQAWQASVAGIQATLGQREAAAVELERNADARMTAVQDAETVLKQAHLTLQDQLRDITTSLQAHAGQAQAQVEQFTQAWELFLAKVF